MADGTQIALNLISTQLTTVTERLILAAETGARIEARQDTTVEHLARINGSLARHDKRLDILEEIKIAAVVKDSAREKTMKTVRAIALVVAGGALQFLGKLWFHL